MTQRAISGAQNKNITKKTCFHANLEIIKFSERIWQIYLVVIIIH